MSRVRTWSGLAVAVTMLAACGGGSGEEAAATPQVGDCTDAGETGIVNVSEDVDVVPCDDPAAASRITLVGEDAEGPTACKTTLAHIGETSVCIEELK